MVDMLTSVALSSNLAPFELSLATLRSAFFMCALALASFKTDTGISGIYARSCSRSLPVLVLFRNPLLGPGCVGFMLMVGVAGFEGFEGKGGRLLPG